MIRAIRKLLLFAAVPAALGAARVSAQAPVLRVQSDSGARDVTGVQGASAQFPLQVFASLGGTTRVDRGAVVVRLFDETIRFWPGSPFFSARDSVFQLAHAPAGNAATLRIPEQFFIQWLPTHFSGNVEYRDGALRVKNVISQATSAQPRPTTSSQRNAAAPTTRGKRIVVIDPGHGGIDSGAGGTDGIEEKDVTLMISNRLAALLRARGYEVHLTRTTDTFIALGERTRLANRWKADEPGALFISIHNKSLKTAPSARGFETFFLADANTADERRVADMENESVKYEKNVRAAGTGLDQVLNGLTNDFYLRASNAFAEVVQRGMAQFHPGPNRGVKRAGFRVLIGALMPAVLVEVAFISNPQEARLLGSSAFQEKVAYSLAESVDTFFRENEPLWVKQ